MLVHKPSGAIEFLNSIFPVKPTSWDALTLESVLIPEAVGKTFPVIIDGELTPIRDNIAHTLTTSPRIDFDG
jgi:hypothetical protein